MGTELYCPVKKIADSIQDNKEPLRHLFLDIKDPEIKSSNIDFTSLYGNCPSKVVLHDIVHIDDAWQLGSVAKNKAGTKYDLITVLCHGSNTMLTVDGSGKIILFSTELESRYLLVEILKSLIKNNGSIFLLACNTYNHSKIESTAKDLANILQRDIYGFDRTLSVSNKKPLAQSDFSNILTIQENKLIPNKEEFKSVDIRFGAIFCLMMLLLGSKGIMIIIHALAASYFLSTGKVVFCKGKTKNMNVVNKIGSMLANGIDITRGGLKRVEPNNKLG